MKKFLSLVCIFSLMTGLTACSNSDEATESEIIQTETMEESVTETETETEEVSETESKTAEETTDTPKNILVTIKNPNTWQYMSDHLNPKRQIILMNMENETGKPAPEKDTSSWGSLKADTIDTVYDETEAEQAKEVLANAVSAFRNRDFATAISGISEFSDIDMIFYGTDGEKYSGEQLEQSLEDYFKFRKVDADNFQSKTLKGDMTSWFLYNQAEDERSSFEAVGEMEVAAEDDEFWTAFDKDSPLFNVISLFNYDMSEEYKIDKAYKQTYDIFDMDSPDNNGEAAFYVARVNGEWKLELVYNTFYKQNGTLVKDDSLLTADTVAESSTENTTEISE